MIELDYEGRLRRAREAMREVGVALMYLRRGANLEYLTGIKRGGPELTDSNTYGDYIQGAYIGAVGGITLVAPRMGGERWIREAEGKPWITEVVVVDESQRPKEVLKRVLGPFNLRGKRVAVEERAWAKTMILFREVLPYSRLLDAGEILEPLRMVKDEEELALMRKAGEITDRVYGRVVESVERGMTQVDVANLVDYEFRKLGAEQNSFVTSVAFRSPKQPWGVVRPLEEGDLISFDFGCVYQGYCSDFGRIMFVGDPPAKVREIHGLVNTAQEAAMERMKPGEISCEDLDKVARGIIERAGYGENFVHRLGHGIGLTVHEPPFLYLPDDTVLQGGMTFTVEPSILLRGEWSARVEDVVLVTEEGGVPFTNYSRDIAIV